MAGSKSIYLANKTLNHNLGVEAYVMPSPRLALFKSADGLEGNVSGEWEEFSGGGYARMPIAFDPAAGGVSSNADIVLFPLATADWAAPVTHWAFMDAESAGNVLYWGNFNEARAVNAGNEFRVRADDIQISED